MAGETLLRSQGITAGYGELQILNGVDLELAPGTITAVIGANGAGKSTLLKAIFGIVNIGEGALWFHGEDITRSSSAERLRRGISLVPQGRCNFPLMTVEENLEMAAYTRRDRGVKRDINALCETFPILREKRTKRAGDMSGGEQQQLEMAMALMLSPSLALLDEPSLGLSAAMQEVVFAAIHRLRERGTSVLMVEQNAVQALRIADRGVVLEMGRIAVHGTGVEMLEDREVRRAYLGLRA